MNVKRFRTITGYALGLFLFVGLIVMCQHIQVEEPDKQILGNFIEWFGILFSILLALIIVQVWTKYNTVDALVDKEADALVSLLRFTRFLKDPKIFENLDKLIYSYCEYFSRSDLPYEKSIKDSRDKLEQIFSKVSEAVRSNERSCVANEIIRCFDEASDTRGDRDALVKERIPGVLWFMMVFTSMIWLLSFFWLASQDVRVHVAAFMLLSTSFTVIGLLLIAKDIDNPVSGLWKVSFTSFEDACKEINRMRGSKGNQH